MAIIYGDNSTNVRAGKVINIQRYEWNTRTGSSNTVSTNKTWIYQSSFNKLESTSNIIIQALIAGWTNNAGTMQGTAYFGSSTEESGIWYQYTASSYGKLYHCTTCFAGNTQTGSLSWGIGYRTANGNTDKPFSGVWNPNSSEDGRLAQVGSMFLVTEVMP